MEEAGEAVMSGVVSELRESEVRWGILSKGLFSIRAQKTHTDKYWGGYASSSTASN